VQDQLAAEATEAARATGLDFDGDILETFGFSQFLPSTQPTDIEISWEAATVSLGQGDTADLYGSIQVGDEPSALCFTATDNETGEIVAASDVVVAWRDDSGEPGLLFASP